MKAHNKAKRQAKQEALVPITIKPQAKGTANRSHEETQLERQKLSDKTKAARRTSGGFTEGKFSTPIRGTTVSYEAFNLERKLITELPDSIKRTKFNRPKKVFKRFGKRG